MSDHEHDILHDLNRGLRMELAQVEQIDEELDQLLAKAKARKSPVADSASARTRENLFAAVGAYVERIRGFVTQVTAALSSNSTPDDSSLADTWRQIRPLGDQLDVAISELERLDGASDASGDPLWSVIENHISVLKAHASAILLKLELRESHTQEEIAALVPDLLAKLPAEAANKEATGFQTEYKKALAEVREEKHRFGGILDALKAMFMYQDTPEEKMKVRQRQQHP